MSLAVSLWSGSARPPRASKGSRPEAEEGSSVLFIIAWSRSVDSVLGGKEGEVVLNGSKSESEFVLKGSMNGSSDKSAK